MPVTGAFYLTDANINNDSKNTKGICDTCQMICEYVFLKHTFYTSIPLPSQKSFVMILSNYFQLSKFIVFLQ